MIAITMLVLLVPSVHATASGVKPDGRIIGGVIASPERGLFQVSLFNKQFRHYCGGAIIRPTWIATAAHCKPVCQGDVQCAVRYGTLVLTGGRVAPIRLFLSHPKYVPETIKSKNDVAVAEAPMIMDSNARPIPLHNYDVPFGVQMVASGWGWVKNENHTCVERLKQTSLKRSKCPKVLSDTFICTLAANTNPCHGDSGGPLTYEGELVGVTGFGANIPEMRKITQIKQVEESTGNVNFSNTKNITRRIHQAKRPGKFNFFTRCFPGVVGNFGYVYLFRSWINDTIAAYTEKYSLDTLPPHKEWTTEYVNSVYVYKNLSQFC